MRGERAHHHHHSLHNFTSKPTSTLSLFIRLFNLWDYSIVLYLQIQLYDCQLFVIMNCSIGIQWRRVEWNQETELLSKFVSISSREIDSFSSSSSSSSSSMADLIIETGFDSVSDSDSDSVSESRTTHWRHPSRTLETKLLTFMMEVISAQA